MNPDILDRLVRNDDEAIMVDMKELLDVIAFDFDSILCGVDDSGVKVERKYLEILLILK